MGLVQEVTDILQQLLNDEAGQDTEARDTVVAVFVVILLLSLARNLVALYDQHLIASATPGVCMRHKFRDDLMSILFRNISCHVICFFTAAGPTDIDFEAEAAATNMLIEEALKVIKALEEKKTTVDGISTKIDEVTSSGRRDLWKIHALTRAFSHSCSQFTNLCRNGLTALQNGDPNIDSLAQEIFAATVGPCSSKEMQEIRTVFDDAARIIEDVVAEIAERNEILQNLQNKLEELYASTTTSSSTTTTTTTTTTSTTITAATTTSPNSQGGYAN